MRPALCGSDEPNPRPHIKKTLKESRIPTIVLTPTLFVIAHGLEDAIYNIQLHGNFHL